MEKKAEIYKGDEIYNIIPNRRPLMILDFLEVVHGESARGIKTLKEDDWFFSCHFPGNPVFPFSLLIETMTQVFLSTFIKQINDTIPLITKIGEVHLKCGAAAGDTIIFEAKLESLRRGLAKGFVSSFKKNGNKGNVLMTEFPILHTVPSMIAAPK